MLKLVQEPNLILGEDIQYATGSYGNSNYAKVFLLRTFLAISEFDISYGFKRCLDSSDLSNDNNSKITGYNLMR